MTLGKGSVGPLRVLLVDDNPDDRALAERSLRESLPELRTEHVFSAEAFQSALDRQDFDLVVTDYHLLWTDGMEVLRRIKERVPDCPVILYTGTGSEEIAAEVMKAGLDDYVLKSSRHLIRLGAAAQAAVERAEQRRRLREAELRYQGLFQDSRAAMLLIDPGNGHIIDANPAACRYYGIAHRDLTQMSVGDLEAGDGARHPAEGESSAGQRLRSRHRLAQGEEREVEIYSGPLRVRERDLHYWIVHDVTEKAQVEDALSRERDTLRRIAETSPAGIIMLDRQGRIVFANTRAEAVFGLKRGALAGGDSRSSGWQVADVDGGPIPHEMLAFSRVIRERQPVSGVEHAIVWPDGRRVQVSINAAPLFDEVGQVDGVVATVEDVTAHRREGRLREAGYRITAAANEAAGLEEFLAAVHREVGQVMDATNLYVGLCDPGRTTLSFAYYTDQHIQGGEPLEPISRPFGQGLTEYAIRGGRSLLLNRIEIDRLTAEGKVAPQGRMPQVWLGVPLRNQEAIVGIIALQHYSNPLAYAPDDVGFLEFVSDQIGMAVARRQGEEALRESEDRFRRLAENAPDLIYRYRLRPEPAFEYVSPAATDITGYTPEEHYADPDLGRKLVHPEDRALLENVIQGPGGPAHPVILRWVRKDGRVIWTEQQNVPILDEAGRLLAIEGIARDVTERMQRERELGGVVRVAAALRHAPTRESMKPVILDQVAVLLGAGGAALAMVQGSTGEAMVELARGKWAAATGVRLTTGTGIMAKVAASGLPYVSDDITADPSVIRPELISATRAAIFVPLVVQDQVIGALGVGRDVPFTPEDTRLLTAIADMAGNALHRAGVMETLEHRVAERTRELEEANARLMELDRLKSEFVSNVSHELRTPITNIQLYLDLLAQPGRSDRAGAYLGIMKNEARRLGRLIEDLLTLSRMERGVLPADVELHSLDPLVGEVLAAHLVRAAAKGIDVVHEPNPSLPVVRVSRAQMTQVFTNLISNAVAYTSAGGVIQVECDEGRIGDQRYAVVRVRNSGVPIAADDLPHVFERFYRGRNARESGEPGTGLGLAITKEIVERHFGWIAADSSEGEGTTFAVWLPIANGPVEAG